MTSEDKNGQTRAGGAEPQPRREAHQERPPLPGNLLPYTVIATHSGVESGDGGSGLAVKRLHDQFAVLPGAGLIPKFCFDELAVG